MSTESLILESVDQFVAEEALVIGSGGDASTQAHARRREYWKSEQARKRGESVWNRERDLFDELQSKIFGLEDSEMTGEGDQFW
jgi:hypothetical protein